MIKLIFITSILFTSTFAQISKLTINSFDNTPIVYQEAGSGEQVLVFIHCWGCDKSYWESQLKYVITLVIYHNGIIRESAILIDFFKVIRNFI